MRSYLVAGRAARFADLLEHSKRAFVQLAIEDMLRADGLDYGVELMG